MKRRGRPGPQTWINPRGEEFLTEAEPYSISKHLVLEAWRLVRANRGAAGVDGESVAIFEKDLKGNLYYSLVCNIGDSWGFQECLYEAGNSLDCG